MKHLLPRTLVLLLTCLPLAASAQSAVTVTQYCTDFAEAYARANALAFQEGSVHTERESVVVQWLSNFFQPRGSRFTSGYDCRFRAGNGEAQTFSVGLFLTGTLAFARHTQWEKLQIIPIAYVTDGDRAGYGVFKYLEVP